MAAPREQRLVFGEVAARYERARPDYPGELVDDVVAYAGLRPGDRALEVGAGTGKATRLLAAHGLDVLALEPSPEMAAVARRVFRGLPVQVVESSFEDAELARGAFALVASAQAWHWVTPVVRLTRSHDVLRPAGCLAVFWNVPDCGPCPLRAAVDAAYQLHAPELLDVDTLAPRPADRWQPHANELDASELFVDVEERVYRHVVRYTAAEYGELMSTHSNHRLLPPDRLAALVDAVAAVIDAEGGTLDLTYESRLSLARAAR